MLLTLHIQSKLASTQQLKGEDFKTPIYEGDANIELQYENQRILKGSLFSVS